MPHVLCVATLMLTLPVAGAAQDTLAVVATRALRAPEVDGRLDDTEWRRATPLTSFRQANPVQGAAATQPMEVRILYDDVAVYVSA